MLHHQLRRGLLGARILRARGLSGHTSPCGHRQLRRGSSVLGHHRYTGTPLCLDFASYAKDSSVLGHRQLRRELVGVSYKHCQVNL